MVDAVDSYFRHVTERMATINPDRQMLGMMDAQDWPPKPVKFESFYLLVLGAAPVSRLAFSATVPVVSHLLQWVWVILGTDLESGKVGRGRGDRYRVEMQMRSELLKGHFPLFAEKKSWSVSGASVSSLQLVGASLDPVEYVWWTPLNFIPKTDQASGVLYGAASLSLVEMTETIAA